MFTLEIEGNAVAVTNAGAEDAIGVFEGPAFRRDLLRLTSRGAPIWNGSAAFAVRVAHPEEVAYLRRMVESDGDDAASGGSSIDVIFLVPVDNLDERAD